MIDFEKNFIEIVKSALNINCEVKIPEDWEKVTFYGKKHKVMPLLYYGISNAGLKMPAEIDAQLFRNTALNMAVNNKQLYELELIRKEFLANRIDFIVLKGADLKQYYPTPEMRPMGDIDILIKTDQYEIIKPIMLKKGFVAERESDHELVWVKDQIMIELHKKLIPSDNKDFYEYFGDGWEKAIPVGDSTEFSYSKEDNFIYLFTHFAKHYRDAGIGIIHIIDIFLFLENNQDMNEEYIFAELQKLHLLDFFENVKQTIEVCFKNGKINEKTDIILERVFDSGSYGHSKANAISITAKKTKKIKNKKRIRFVLFFKRVFMPYKYMCGRHKVLKKAPVLLPFFWIYRIFGVLFKSKNLKREINYLKYSNPDEVVKFYKELNKVGLDYNFDE